MIITATTRLEFKPRTKQETEDGHYVAFYDMAVGDEKLGLTEIVVSKGRDSNTIIEAEDGTRFERDQLAEALIHAGHKVEYD